MKTPQFLTLAEKDNIYQNIIQNNSLLNTDKRMVSQKSTINIVLCDVTKRQVFDIMDTRIERIDKMYDECQ